LPFTLIASAKIGDHKALILELSRSACQYLMEKPLFVDDSNLRKLIPEIKKTSYNDGIENTLKFLSTNQVAPSRDNIIA
jgi:hypothetical protein